jgi:hypothetical protein
VPKGPSSRVSMAIFSYLNPFFAELQDDIATAQNGSIFDHMPLKFPKNFIYGLL